MKSARRSSSATPEGRSEPPYDERLRRGLAQQIAHIIRARNISQADAAKRLGIDQPKVSALMHGRVAGFSTDRLLRFLNALGRDIDIVIRGKPPGRERARVRVRADRQTRAR